MADLDKKLVRCHQLIALSSSSYEEEARSAAFLACKLIRELGFVVVLPREAYQREQSYDQRHPRQEAPPPAPPPPPPPAEPKSKRTSVAKKHGYYCIPSKYDNSKCKHCTKNNVIGELVWWKPEVKGVYCDACFQYLGDHLKEEAP
jgi:hypothetical protein